MLKRIEYSSSLSELEEFGVAAGLFEVEVEEALEALIVGGEGGIAVEGIHQ